MKRMRRMSWIVLMAAVLVMAVNHFLTPLPDWAVRTDGVLMLAAMATFSFAAVRCAQQKR